MTEPQSMSAPEHFDRAMELIAMAEAELSRRRLGQHITPANYATDCAALASAHLDAFQAKRETRP